MSIRAEKVSSEIKKIISNPISQISREVTVALVTVTAVRVSNDLQNAKVYVSIFGKNASPGEILDLLELKKGELKHEISKKMRLRYIPELKFFLDDTLDQIDNIKKILDEVKNSDEDNS